MNRNTLLAIVLTGAVILLMPYYYRLITPPSPAPGADSTAAVQAPAGGLEPGKAPSRAERGAGGREAALPAGTPAGMGATPLQTDLLAPDTAAAAREVVVETPLYRARFSTLGATVRSWIIKPTQPYLHEPEELVREQYARRNLVLTARGGRGLLRTEEKVFQVDRSRLVLDSTDAPATITFTLPLGEGRWYRESYTFHPDRYAVDLHIESRGLGELIGAASAVFSWGGGLAPTEEDSAQDLYYTEASYLMGRNKEKFTTRGKKAREEQPTGPTQWVAQRTKYFLCAIVPETPADGASLYTWPDSLYQGKYTPKLFDTGLVFNIAGGDIDRDLTLYLGPLEQGFLSQVDPSLKQTISWGMAVIRPFSKIVLWTLVLLHRFIPNYGVVLILFSVLIKLIIWPLTHKSHASMKRMQLLQPKIKEIQAKYKSNPQKMQQEVMALYKEHKVNPMGGCWPMLLQMPLLYALFIVFRSTIELRGQPFILWIKDLSMPDVLFTLPFTIPLYGDHVCVLPLVMAVSTYLQSKTTMTDPNQKAMLYMMPLMFIFLFNNFPSGLTLYYTLFNLLSWAQQRMMKIEDPAIAKTVAGVKEEEERKARREARRKRKA